MTETYWALPTAMFRYVLGFFIGLWAAAAFAEVALVVLKSPTQVVARYDDPGFEGKDCGLFTVTLALGEGKNAFSEASMLFRCGNTKTSLKTQVRRLVSWRPPYLALHTECGMSNGWNCDTWVIYAYRDGALTRLGHVNDFLVRDQQTLFRKNYTLIEYNDLVAHTGQRLPVVLRDAGAGFAFDAEQTWLLNREIYQRFAGRELLCPAQQPKCDDAFKTGLVFNSSVAKLAGKQAELQALLATAKQRLNAEDFKTLNDMLAGVDAQGVVKYMAEETY